MNLRPLFHLVGARNSGSMLCKCRYRSALMSHKNRSFSSSEQIQKVMVVGSGVIGLRTALELLERNIQVVLRSPFHPLDPRTTSMGAGGLWMPFHAKSDRLTQWSHDTLTELLLPEHKERVERLPVVQLFKEHNGPEVEDFTVPSTASNSANSQSPSAMPRLPDWTSDARLEFQHLTVEMLSWQNKVHQLRIPREEILKDAGYLHAWMFQTAIVDTPRYLQYMLDAILQHDTAVDVNVETKHMYTSIDEICRVAASEHGCDAVMNCAGLGSRELCADDDLVGARGVTLQFDRSSCRYDTGCDDQKKDAVLLVDEPPWGSNTMPAYLIPRGDVVLVGGSCLEGDTEPTLRPSEREQLLRNARHFGIDVDAVQPLGEWTGFRPSRTAVRCELDEQSASGGMKVVHNYGHGGSGWTIFAGVAKHSVDLLLGKAQ